jgi:hypothetical protein
MEEIFKKIDEMFESEEISKEILNELRSIKAVLLGGLNRETREKRKLNKAYYKFYYEFREKMRERPREGYYPEFEIDGKVYAINTRGLMYNKKSGKILSKKEAFEIYERIFYDGYFVSD